MVQLTSEQFDLRPAGSHGLGVFALRTWHRGERVIACAGRELPASQVTDDMRALQISPDTFLAEDPDQPGFDDYMNHSCDPNVGFTSGTAVFHALRVIAVGDELTWDYATGMNEAGWSVPCRCGAKGCRGVIQSYCDLPAQVQTRLRPLALHYLRD